MKTLLRIDSSPRTSSKTRELTSRFEQQWLAANPDGLVIRRDLAHVKLPFLNEEWIAAAYTPEAQQTAEQKQVLALSDELISELQVADEIVIGVPMWNFGPPASLKAYIDLIARRGKTFNYTEKGPVGLLGGRKLIVVTARGGFYTEGSPVARFDFQEPYLRQVFQFLGITDITFAHAEFQGMGGDRAARSQSVAEQAMVAWMNASAQKTLVIQ